MVDRTLGVSTDQLARAGFHARSGWMRSPTFGGISWLAHSTLQTGLWIDSQQRYDQVLSGDRFTLSRAFGNAGWRTVSDIPSDDGDVGAGPQLLRVRPDVRLPQRRLPGAALQLRADPRPVHASARSSSASWTAPAAVR